jgi:CRP/FNR family transcriptional regulator, nitrogen fixation regulation protein
MPTQTAVQDVSSPPRFGRAMRKEPWDGFHEPMRSTELTGAPMSFARNVEIYRENDRADRLYKVVSGTVRTCKILIDGRRQIAAFYLPGDTFGLAPAATHMFSAEAASDAKVLVIKRGVVASLQLGGLMRRELQLAQGHFLLLVKTAPERVASFLLEMADRIRSDDEVELPMSRRDMADYLGLTIETVSRTLTQLAHQSAIALPTSKRVVLRNRAVLQRLIA